MAVVEAGYWRNASMCWGWRGCSREARVISSFPTPALHQSLASATTPPVRSGCKPGSALRPPHAAATVTTSVTFGAICIADITSSSGPLRQASSSPGLSDIYRSHPSPLLIFTSLAPLQQLHPSDIDAGQDPRWGLHTPPPLQLPNAAFRGPSESPAIGLHRQRVHGNCEEREAQSKKRSCRQSSRRRRSRGIERTGVIVNPKGEMKGSAIMGPIGKDYADLWLRITTAANPIV
ncbi:hypothetical protein Taro_029626 [Colocasia esculenta]|uniref:Ribosomal protein L14 n=1 Tax=Colocasia esculenta TaxID=4460 RepID=A0A843VKA2_COLES|nr:hypothetical protein [Colocasia esculenta]